MDILQSNRTNIGIKRMGEIDDKAFLAECKRRYTVEEALVKASEGSSLWQENLKDPAWHPFRIIENNGTTEVSYGFLKCNCWFFCLYYHS